MCESATAFLRHRGDVLACRHAGGADTRELWDGVSVAVDPATDPTTAIEDELREIVGLDEPSLVRRGDPLAVDGKRSRTVHPFCFEIEPTVSRPDVDPERVSNVEWIAPSELLERETVSGLWESYRRVAPTVDVVREDTIHGSAWLSYRTLEILRDRAAETAVGIGETDVEALARTLRNARPSMVVGTNRLHRALAAAGGLDSDPKTIADAATATLRAAYRDDETAGVRARERVEAAIGAAVDDGVERPAVATLSRSGTVSGVLQDIDASVVVAESRPGAEGTAVAADLADESGDVTLLTDAGLFARVLDGEVACGLVGADRILPDGSVINKVGTAALALACDRADLPLVVAAAADKIAPKIEWTNESRPATDLYDGEAPVAVENPVFDRTPGDLVTVVTEEGVLDVDDVERIAERHRERTALLWTDGDTGTER